MIVHPAITQLHAPVVTGVDEGGVDVNVDMTRIEDLLIVDSRVWNALENQALVFVTDYCEGVIFIPWYCTPAT